MTLSDLCEPLFVCICQLNRMGRRGGLITYEDIRRRIESVFADMHNQASASADLFDQFARIENPLVYFVDSWIAESHVPIAREWDQNRLAFARGELAGDQKFFDLLEETLGDPNVAAANERLAVFYTCIGLGFVGYLRDHPDELRLIMDRLARRIGASVDERQELALCPEAYQHVNREVLIEPPGPKLVGIGIGLMGLIVVLLITNVHLYRESSEELRNAVQTIVDEAKPSRKGLDLRHLLDR